MGSYGKKTFALLVSVALVFSMVSTTSLTAFADEISAAQVDLRQAASPMSSQIGSTTWTLDADGTLTIASTLASPSWMEAPTTYPMPKKDVKRIVLSGSLIVGDSEDGGDYKSSLDIFKGFENLESIAASQDAQIEARGNLEGLFGGCTSLVDISGSSGVSVGCCRIRGR